MKKFITIAIAIIAVMTTSVQAALTTTNTNALSVRETCLLRQALEQTGESLFKAQFRNTAEATGCRPNDHLVNYAWEAYETAIVERLSRRPELARWLIANAWTRPEDFSGDDDVFFGEYLDACFKASLDIAPAIRAKARSLGCI